MKPCYLGIDIGSISTKGVIIDDNNNIIVSEYIWTEGSPINAVSNLLAKLKNKFHYLFDEISVESKVGEFHNYSRTSFPTMQFFDLLWYLKTDEFIRDGSIGHKLMNVAQEYADKYTDDNATYFYPRSALQYQIRYGSWIDLTTVDPKFSGLQIKFFQNGKVQMKGLSSEDWDKIVHLDEICSRK